MEVVSFSADQLALIKDLCGAEPCAPSAWAEDSVKDLKATIKSHYIHAQATTCCYCQRHLASENHRVWDIDHVVPRSTHPRFMFEPLNLVACCPDCNRAKKDQRVLKNNRRKKYPTKSTDFLILHPHFDEYADHIFRQQHVYLGKTEKGKRTIYVCDLLRFAQKYIAWPNAITDSRFESEVDVIVAGGSDGAAAVQQIARSLQI
ncbi:HNH endonuclease domain-containing protein [Microbacter sp. GSS18]|nr:HNH endonuclease domain-containing protein [Microbacter sp. GSS18]